MTRRRLATRWGLPKAYMNNSYIHTCLVTSELLGGRWKPSQHVCTSSVSKVTYLDVERKHLADMPYSMT